MRPPLFVIMMLMMASLSACNTFAGLGQDMRSAGTAMEQTAREVQN